jgi:hypothetical protein
MLADVLDKWNLGSVTTVCETFTKIWKVMKPSQEEMICFPSVEVIFFKEGSY